MNIQKLVGELKKYFPNVEIKYKDESSFMKFLGTLLFFNKEFMKSFTTTIGDTIYFPNKEYVERKPVTSKIILLHELVHIYDSHRIGRILYSLSYLFPQILAPLALLLLLVSWKIALPVMVFLMLPLPAIFRMHYEKRAYMVSLYAKHHIGKKLDLTVDLDKSKEHHISQFKTGAYYFMWIFDWKLTKDFNTAVEKIKAGKRPYEDKVFDIIDDLIEQL